MYALLLPLCLFFSTQVLIRPVLATRPNYSMALDYSKIFCNGHLPKRTFGVITKNWSFYNQRWSHLNFTSLADLCSAHGNPKGNMGGKVHHPQLFLTTPHLPPPSISQLTSIPLPLSASSPAPCTLIPAAATKPSCKTHASDMIARKAVSASTTRINTSLRI
jgi:hypothetical protein